MGFKQGKSNPYNVLKTENEYLRAQLADAKMQPILTHFANQVGEAILIQLSMTAYKDWPQVAKNAFDHCGRMAPTTAWLYQRKLPK
jgi:hypothetical protein